MKKKKREERLPSKTDCKKRLAARIPISEWYELDRKMAIISRMSTEPVKESGKAVST